jgi:hypothetical protein
MARDLREPLGRFIDAHDSPIRTPVLVQANPVTGTVTLRRLDFG